MTKTFCDACGKELYRKATLEFHTKCDGADSMTRHVYMDLCNECLEKTVAFIDDLRKAS